MEKNKTGYIVSLVGLEQLKQNDNVLFMVQIYIFFSKVPFKIASFVSDGYFP